MPDESVEIDLIAEDPKTKEFVLYLLEDGPWPKECKRMKAYLARIESRVLAAVDAAILGVLAEHYPDSVGHPVRVEVDSPHGAPTELELLMERLQAFMNSDQDFLKRVRDCRFISGIKLVTGKELGRFP